MNSRVTARSKIKISKRWVVLTILLSLCSMLAVAIPAPQQEEDAVRKMWFRPPPPQKRAKPTLTPSPINNQLIGVTIWKLRSATKDDSPSVTRIYTRRPSTRSDQSFTRQDEVVPERANTGMTFSPGDSLMISVEVPRPRAHYLYVIAREVYGDRSIKNSSLIFPTKVTPDADRVVRAGKTTFVPSRYDFFGSFDLRPKKDQISELLTIIISPDPHLLSPGDGPRTLDLAEAERVKQWEKEWMGVTEQIEARNNLKQTMTIAEKGVRDGTRELVPSDPLPQTIYRMEAKANLGKPVMINVSLCYARAMCTK